MAQFLMFDFDGTLVDTAPDIIRAVNEFLISKNHEPLSDEDIIRSIGLGLKHLLHEVIPEARTDVATYAEVESEFLKTYHKHLLGDPQPMPGAIEFLKQWPHAMAIVSNKREHHVRTVLRHLELDQLPWVAVIGGDTYPRKKPDPMPLAEAMRLANVSPSQTLMVGDGIPDVEAAQAARVKVVVVEFGYNDPDDLMRRGGWKKISHFSQLNPLVASLTERSEDL